MSNWLVTGGAGFIGSNFVRLASKTTDARIVVLDVLTYAGNLANIADLVDSRRIEFVRGDVCDVALLASLFQQCSFDKVVHFAAESHVDRSILGSQPFLHTNVTGTYTLLEAARLTWSEVGQSMEGKVFLHVSTDEVYGALGPEDPPFTEQNPYRPNSPYSASKAASDHLVRAWYHTYGLPGIITNCSNNYGPWQFPEKLIPLMAYNAYEQRELPVYGDGLQVRDWLHVRDHCEALLTVLDNGARGETYVIGGNNERTNLNVVECVCATVDELTGRIPGTSAKLIRHVKDRPGHDRRYALDASKIRTRLGWIPRHGFEASLKGVVKWYLEHKDWAAAIRSGEYKAFYERQYGER